jgi:glycosyltransferase involved in cell wall biosynthesis
VTADLDHPSKLLELIDSETLQSARRARWRAPRTLVRAAAAAVLEGCAVRRFTACTAVSEADARTVRKLAPRVPVQVVPNGVDAEYFSPLAIKEDPGSLVFTGAMSFPPNVTAVLDFCRHTLPLIQQTMPGVRLTIVGRDPSPAVAALSANPAVTVTGFVEDIRPYLSRSNVTICPMSTGSGIKNKVLEALAMGRAVVTSRLGAEALEVTDGRHLRVADDPQSFAQAVVALLGDEAGRRRLGIAGRALVLRRYTWDACATTYERLYEDLIPGETGVRPMRRRQHAV